MKTRTLLTTLIAIAAISVMAQNSAAPDIADAAPVVVKAVPEAGSRDVAPGEVEIKVTFSKEMMDQAWSWCNAWDNSLPEFIGKPHYEADHKTCVLKVKLEPGKTYGFWINTQKFNSFQDKQHRHAVPYLLAFTTSNN